MKIQNKSRKGFKKSGKNYFFLKLDHFIYGVFTPLKIPKKIKK